MFRPFEIFIGLRYTRAKRRNHFISFISWISILGIALGVTVLITVLSVMNGFERELRDRILSMTSHVSVLGYDRRVSDWEPLMEELLGYDRVEGAAPYIQGEAMLRSGRDLTGGIVRGILPEQEGAVSEVGEQMVAGSMADLRPGEFNIVLGRLLAENLGVRAGGTVDVMVPEASVTPAGVVPRMRRFHVVGLFDVDMYEYDRSHAFIHMQDAARLYRMDDDVTGVRLRLDDLFASPWVRNTINPDLQPGLYATDWTRQHGNFFRAIQIEKTVMFIILMLIVAVAAFNIVSTLVMVVTEKQADIAILRTLGVSPAGITGVFMVQGMVIGVIGTGLGVIGGVALALNVEALVAMVENLMGMEFMLRDVYYISELPSELQKIDVVRIGAMALALALVSTLYPAWSASRTDPAEALRYE